MPTGYWEMSKTHRQSLPTHTHAKARWQLALRGASLTIVDGILLKQRVSTAIQL